MNLKKELYALMILAILIGTASPSTTAQDSSNFSLTIIVPSDNQRIRSMVNLFDDYWNPLHVSINIVGFPEVVFLQNLVNPLLDWDMAIVSFNGGEKEDPGLLDLYHPDFSSFAKEIFPTDDKDLMDEIGISQDFLTLLEEAYFTPDPSRKNSLLAEFQKRFNEEWLIDLPLFSKLGAVVSYRQLIGFNPQEGLANSIYSGMHWDSNPKRRADQGGTMDNLRLVIQNPTGSFNPLLSNSLDYNEINSLIFPQLMLFDSQANPYPDLAIGYEITDFQNGSRIMDIRLRENANWVDNDGQSITPITAKDVKFTFDMLRFPWVPTLSNNLIARIEGIRMLNESSVRFMINRGSPSDLYLIGSQLIVPEHALNGTLTKQGSPLGNVYEDQISPIESDEWTNFASFPVTGSMYFLDSKSENFITLRPNPSYWFPTTEDIVSSSWNPDMNFFFNWNDNPQTQQIERPSSALINEITSSIVEDRGTAALQFHFGVFDIFRSQAVGSKELYLDDPDIINLDYIPKGYVETILLNYDNLFLRDFKVRKALLAALNRTEILQVIETNQQIQYSPISQAYKDLYSDEGAVRYDYGLARDLFREVGYFAEESSTINYTPPEVNLPFPVVPFIGFIALIPLIRKKKERS